MISRHHEGYAPPVPEDGSIAISVVMATYNGERHLREQLISILDQLSPEDELVISDDRSNDATLQIIESFESDRIRVVSTSGRLGPTRNFEHGLQYARGGIIVLSDQDDKWLPDRLGRVRDHFSTRATYYDLLVMNSRVVDGDLNTKADSLFDYLRVGPGLRKNILRNTYVGCHMAFRRELLAISTPFPRAIPMHDMWFGLISERVGFVTFDPHPTMLWRRHENNFTQAGNSFFQRLAWRMGLVFSLTRLMMSNQFRKRRRHISGNAQ